MSNQILQDLRGSIFELQDIINDIDKSFQFAESYRKGEEIKSLFLEEIKKIETKLSNEKYDLDSIRSRVNDKMEEWDI